MSSAILYLAIVAIWACVLIPRWLHRSHEATSDPEVLADQEETADYGEAPGRAEFGAQAEPGTGAPAHVGPAPAANRPSLLGPACPLGPAVGRAHILQARRRMLTVLVALAVAAMACVLAGVMRWWTAIPPLGMLVVYLLLLREAAHADADARRRAEAHARAQAARAARERAREAHARARAARSPQPAAEVIDISGRTAAVADQLYDQYADATVRAIGD